MKALVKAKAEEGIWLQDMPEPECGNNDVIVATFGFRHILKPNTFFSFCFD